MTTRESSKLDVLVTGTRGRVGTAIIPELVKKFNVTEFDTAFAKDGSEAQIKGDITELGVISGAVKRIRPDCIVHLAANSNEHASAEEIEPPNYTGLRNIYEAAARYHVPKVVFASSFHTLSGYPGFPHKSPFEDGRKFRPTDEPKPGSPYGESKVWGEKLAREYYEKFGIHTVILRIGALHSDNKPPEGFEPLWLSHRDAVQAFSRAIVADTPEPVATYFVTSNNDGSAYDLQPTIDDLGYAPEDGITKT